MSTPLPTQPEEEKRISESLMAFKRYMKKYGHIRPICYRIEEKEKEKEK